MSNLVIELNCSTKTPLQRRFAQQVGRLLTDRDEGMGIEVEERRAKSGRAIHV